MSTDTDERRPALGEAPRSTSGDGDGDGPTPLDRVRAGVLGGDRPYAVAFVATLGLAVVVVSGPIETYSQQRDIVERREAVLAALEEENAELAARVRALNDPDTIEAEAREEQGMYRPGEVPYVIVPPPVDQPQLGPDVPSEDGPARGWWQRVRDAIGDVFA